MSSDLLFEAVLALFFFLIGLCLGSFASVIISREKTGKNWFSLRHDTLRSACPGCARILGIADLVPVASWLFLRGRCRSCGMPIPLFYPLLEIFCGLASLAIYLNSGVTVMSLTALLCLPFFVSLTYLGFADRRFSLRLVALVGGIGIFSFLMQSLILK